MLSLKREVLINVIPDQLISNDFDKENKPDYNISDNSKRNSKTSINLTA